MSDPGDELAHLARNLLSLPDLGLPRSGSYDDCVTETFREELLALRRYTADLEPKVIALIPKLIAISHENSVLLGERLQLAVTELHERIRAMEGVKDLERKLIRRDTFRAEGEHRVGPFRTELTAIWAAKRLTKAQGRDWAVKSRFESVGAWSIQIWDVVEAPGVEARRKGPPVLNLGNLRAENAQRSRN